MTSLHVICSLGSPIKNPGYAYGVDAIENLRKVEIAIISLQVYQVIINMFWDPSNIFIGDTSWLLSEDYRNMNKNCTLFSIETLWKHAFSMFWYHSSIFDFFLTHV